MKTAVLGTSGYTGLILLRLLSDHPHVTDIIPVSFSQHGTDIFNLDPGLSRNLLKKMPSTKGNIISLDQAANLKIDCVFAALPHLKSALLCKPFFGNSVVIDLSADFRIQDPLIFEKAYGSSPPRIDLLEKAVYGLSEWYGKEIQQSDIIANPGCYPTASLLPLLPLLREKIIKGEFIINAISGISGAGKKPKINLLYSERTENAGAYSPGKTHRHTPEIEQELKLIDSTCSILFIPHLSPLKRGMAVTIIAHLNKKTNPDDIRKSYELYYKKSPFIVIRDDIPQTRDVWNSNRCDISFHTEGNSLILFSVIDNLMKGAAGQAIQNMNIRFGIEETTGLKTYGEL